jgi:hypothetical protein
VAANAAALSQLQLAWLLTRLVTRRGTSDPGGSAAARLRAGTHVPKAMIGQGAWDPAGSVAAFTACGPACEGKTPLGFGGRPAGVRRKTPKGRRLVEVSPAARVDNCWATRPWRGPVARSTPRDKEKGKLSPAVGMQRLKTVRRDGSAREVWRRGSGVRAGGGVWGRPEARRLCVRHRRG